jgi:hypothetical protein
MSWGHQGSSGYIVPATHENCGHGYCVRGVPPKFDMLLSRSWIKILGGTLQMELAYATIPVFGGEHRRLNREAQLAYIISDEEYPTNNPIFVLDIDLGSNLL